MEIWKDVLGYEGLYQVSNAGNVRSSRRPMAKGGVRKKNESHGYLRVVLCKNGIVENKAIHRLVAEAFIENPNNYPVVNHMDENRTNNNVNNLEWCTQLYNVQYSKWKTTNILQISKDGMAVKQWRGALEAERAEGFDNSAIIKCCKGKRKTHRGYRWEYIELK